MSSNLVLRSFFISPSLDERLRATAFKNRTSKNELIRQYLEAGMAVVNGQPAAKKAAAKKVAAPAAKKATAKKAAAKKSSARKAAKKAAKRAA